MHKKVYTQLKPNIYQFVVYQMLEVSCSLTSFEVGNFSSIKIQKIKLCIQ